ncbi:WYL domain-containing protein [Vineibacter terrae]|uniref:WYL domain-containing protein n=1 Tax=Vineibacter terrae TaxID=2586908 RepID=A0A5C8PBX5_9HYPH|nr:WYL domain-containing protein [Vineibacter terrae]TXL70873.1 WYL domain-containing protein [Vineibacter terrae]
MSFSKAEQLLDAATMASGRLQGITIDDVMSRFRVARRTAQRLLHTLEAHFPDVETHLDDEGRKRWRLPPAHLRDLLTLSPEELAALDLAVTALKRSGARVEARHLTTLREKILALVPRSRVARLETDHEALLQAQGLAARPGPRPRTDPKIAGVVAEAIKACCLLDIQYRSRGEAKGRRRRIAPYGVLSGLRRYVVGKPADALDGPVRLFRFEAITSASLTKTAFVRPSDFSLQDFADRAFGTFQNEEEYGQVVWRFAPAAAEQAREFEFHPQQVVEEEKDGSLIVRFKAAGHLEMCWFLYSWGNQVEVLAPERLRRMCAAHRRGDFAAMP